MVKWTVKRKANNTSCRPGTMKIVPGFFYQIDLLLTLVKGSREPMADWW